MSSRSGTTHQNETPAADERSARARGLTHASPAEVSLQEALDALADPMRRTIVRELAGDADWSRSCGSFDLPVSKATRSHHFAVLRAAGLVEQRDEGSRRLNRLRRTEFDVCFPGLLALVIDEPRHQPEHDTAPSA
jgi:DNA-binding transcriptional ArsR family regulator